MDTIYLSDFKDSFENYVHVLPVFQNGLNVVLLNNDNFVIDCYLHTALKKTFSNNINTSENETFNGVPFRYNFNYSMFDVSEIASMFDNFIHYLDHISQNQLVFNNKLTIIVLNVHLLNKSQQHVFARVFDSLKKNYTVVVTSTSLSKLVQQIASRFTCVRIQTTDLESIVVKYASEHCITYDPQLLKNSLSTYNSLYPLLLALHSGLSTNIVFGEVSKIVETCKKSRIIPTMLAKIRTNLYKLFIYNITHSQLCQFIYMSIFQKYNKKLSIENMQTIIHHLSTLEYNLLKCSKPIYHYELFFLNLFKVFNK